MKDKKKKEKKKKKRARRRREGRGEWSRNTWQNTERWSISSGVQRGDLRGKEPMGEGDVERE